MSQQHQLAAIMFTDIVGYTYLMSDNEDNAFNILKINRELQKPLIKQYQGTFIKELGDGMLASFTTVTNAVFCAGEIINASREIPGLQLRIGIHLGEIVMENNDIFGDGVNIASRIITQASPGGICVSETVHQNISNKKGITSNFLREEILKNVIVPVKIYEVIVESSETYHNEEGRESRKVIAKHKNKQPGKSVAVLPFVNMSNDAEQEYFSDGITEEIINSLTHIKDLRVAGRTSSFHFKNKNIDLRKIGRELNVDTVLEGSVRRQNNKLRITAQLIKVEDGFHLWSERYDRELDDIFVIQDEIALAITQKLQVTLLDEEKAIIQTNPTANKMAYDLYLKGRYYFNKRGAGIIKSLEYFEEVIKIDSEFTLAYSGMADAYCILSLYCILSSENAMPKAKKYALKALELNPVSAEAHTALAFISTFYDWNWPEARQRFQTAFKINPDYASAYYWHSYYLSFVEKDFEKAIEEACMAAEKLEPLVPISHHIVAIMYNNAGRFKEGLAASKKAIEIDEQSYPGYRSMAISYAGLQNFTAAIEAANKAVLLSGRQPLPMVELAWIYKQTGETEEIEKIMKELLTRSETEYISTTFLCCLSSYLGDMDNALSYLQTSFEERDCTIPCINVYPIASYVKDDLRFQPIIKKLQFPAMPGA